MLKVYVRHGRVIDKRHEIISFKQSKWLVKYISFNTQKRIRAKSDFEKDFFKLLANAAFSRMMEKVRNQLKIELIKKHDFKKKFSETIKINIQWCS